MTKNTRLSTPAQLQFRVPERGSLGTRLVHIRVPGEPGNEANGITSRESDPDPAGGRGE